jgi:hypothetical protein
MVRLLFPGGGPLPPGTVTAAVPYLLASRIEVARTVRLEEVSPEATVNTPVKALIVVPELAAPVTLQVTFVGGLLVPITVAVKVWDAPLATVGEAGLTLTLVTLAPVELTITVAVPNLLVSTVEVARTVKLSVVSPAAIVNTPPVLITVPVATC